MADAKQVQRFRDAFRAPQAKDIVGISYRQLDYWDRTGLVRPSVRAAAGEDTYGFRTKTSRLYSFDDLIYLRVIQKLLECGVGLPQIRKAIDYLKEVAVRHDLERIVLASDGNRIYAPETYEVLTDLLDRGQAAWAVSIGKVAADLEASLSLVDRAKEASQLDVR